MKETCNILERKKHALKEIPIIHYLIVWYSRVVLEIELRDIHAWNV